MTTTKPHSGMRLSVAEFLDLPDTDDRRKMELDDGELYLMPRPRFGHQFLMRLLASYIQMYLDTFEQPPAEVHHEAVTILSRERGLTLVPDLIVILRARADIVVEGYAEGAPDIAVEILSSDRNRDLVRKRQLYAEAGVREYWIVDPAADSVTLLGLDDGGYVERAALTAADTLTTPLLPGLAITLADVFHHRQRPPGEDE